MKKTELIPYGKRAKELLAQLEEVKYSKPTGGVKNALADALVARAASLSHYGKSTI